MDRWIDGRTLSGWMDGWMEEWTEGRKDGQGVDDWMDVWIDRWKLWQCPVVKWRSVSIATCQRDP